MALVAAASILLAFIGDRFGVGIRHEYLTAATDRERVRKLVMTHTLGYSRLGRCLLAGLCRRRDPWIMSSANTASIVTKIFLYIDPP